MDVLRGPTSVRYGSNAMGGVLNIVTRSMLEDGVKTLVNIGAGGYGTVRAEATNQGENRQVLFLCFGAVWAYHSPPLGMAVAVSVSMIFP